MYKYNKNEVDYNTSNSYHKEIENKILQFMISMQSFCYDFLII